MIGYHGAVGENIQQALCRLLQTRPLEPIKWSWDVATWRFNHFETIHTIAWCIILNGIIHGYLSSKEKYRDKAKLIKTYILLAVVVLALTPLMWGLAKIDFTGLPGTSGDILLIISADRRRFHRAVYPGLLPSTSSGVS